MNTQTKTYTIKTGCWSREKQWPKIVEWTRKATSLTPCETEQFKKSLAAEIIAATAYLSGCKNPDRIALSHMTTFIAAVKCPEVFSQKEGETIRERLDTGNFFPGGNEEVVKCARVLLELLSLNDHKTDISGDILKGRYNPLILEIDYKEEKEKLLREYNQFSLAVKGQFNALLGDVLTASSWG